MRFVAIDQGTTSTRALVLRGDGTSAIARSIKHEQFYPEAGWVEHDPQELLANIIACLEAVGPVDAIGLSNQGESCLAWDAETGRALSPVIVWQDSRTSAEIETLRTEGAAETVLEHAGLPLDPYFSASKLRWLIDNVAAVRDARDGGRLRLGTTDAWFLQNLTGTCATDITTASRTSLMNLATGAWDERLCEIFGIPVECLPEIRPTVGDFGRCRFGPVTAVAANQQAALYGHGCRKQGDLKITFGTGAFCLSLMETLPVVADLPRGLLPTVAWRIGEATTYALDGGVYDVGSAIEWSIRTGVAASVDDFQSFEASPAIERNLAFVPAFSGLACPHWDRSAAPVLIGLTHASELTDIRQALIEGIVFLTCDVIDAMNQSTPVRDTISIDGGLSRSDYFCQFLADMSGRTIQVLQIDDITALGMASMAARGLGRAPKVATDDSARKFQPHAMPRDAWKQKFRKAVELTKGWNG